MDVLDDGLTRVNNLSATWGFDVDALPQERAQQTLATVEAGDGTAETMDLSHGGVVNASSAPIGRAETAETMVPPRFRQEEPKATRVQHQSLTAAKGTGKIPTRSCRGGLHTSSAAGDDSPRQYGVDPRVRANACGVNLLVPAIDERWPRGFTKDAEQPPAVRVGFRAFPV